MSDQDQDRPTLYFQSLQQTAFMRLEHAASLKAF